MTPPLISNNSNIDNYRKVIISTTIMLLAVKKQDGFFLAGSQDTSTNRGAQIADIKGTV